MQLNGEGRSGKADINRCRGRSKVNGFFMLIIAGLALFFFFYDTEGKTDTGLDKAKNEDQSPIDNGKNCEENGYLNEGDRDIREDSPVLPPDNLPEEIKNLPPNELGEVMILMYHEIGYPEDEWCRTPENFRKDLELLYEEGYRPVSVGDLLDGNIHIPEGTTPVVLTFDDSTEGQFRYIEENGELIIDPDCAVGIMEKFYREHPDFGLAATFYIFYENPFRQPGYVEKKLNYLVEQGFEIGNHAYTHANLSRVSEDEVKRQLGKHVQRTREYVPDYNVRSLALPYGAMPSPGELAIKGTYNNTSYYHEAVLLVGWHPAPSPFSKEFNTFLPRIRASEMKTDGVGMYEWIKNYKNNPEKRYLSDGNHLTVTIPETAKGQLGEKASDKEVVYTERINQ